MAKVEKQLIFIDDSGDPGFKGATSANFVMAAAVFCTPETTTKVNEAISRFRKSLGWKEETEFKFRKTNKRIIRQLLEMVDEYDFWIYAAYVDKTSYTKMLQVFDKEKLYNWTVKELLKIIPLNNAYVKIDGRSTREHKLRFASYIRHEINVSGPKIRSFKTEDSVKDNLIQLADLVAGSINRSMQIDKSDHDDYIGIRGDKIKQIKRLDLSSK